MVSIRMLILSYTMQQVIPIVPNFKILSAVVPDKSLTQLSLCITLEWEMEKQKNEGKY